MLLESRVKYACGTPDPSVKEELTVKLSQYIRTACSQGAPGEA